MWIQWQEYIIFKYIAIELHSSEIRGLCLMKLSNNMLQNLLYFSNKKSQIVFFRFSIWATLDVLKVSQIEKRKKTSWVFLFQKYSKFWSALLDNFIKHKSLISEECDWKSSNLVEKQNKTYKALWTGSSWWSVCGVHTILVFPGESRLLVPMWKSLLNQCLLERSLYQRWT